MNIVLNGKKTEISSKTVSGLLKELDMNSVGKFVAVNGKVIHWTDYDKYSLKKDDSMEIKTFLSGG
ncbi:sulfur carrier protein ThiS [Elusimicrobiota bacterium]